MWWDRLASGVLALLVAASLGLSARLWTSPLLERADPRGPVAYVAPDGVAEVRPGSLILPLRVGLGFGGGRYGMAFPGSVALDGYLWPLLARAAAAVPASALRAVEEEELPWQGGVFAEAVLPFALPTGPARRLLAVALSPSGMPEAAGSASAGWEPGAPRVDRVVLTVEGGRALLAWRYPGGALVFEADRAGAPEQAARAVREAAGSLMRTLPLLPAAGVVPARLLPAEVGTLRVVPGAMVPSGMELPIAQRLAVPYDRESFAQTFFPDLGFTRQATGKGVWVYAAQDATLSLYQDGSAEFRRAPQEPEPAGADPAAGLVAAVEFARGRGGWPEGAVLSGVEPLRAARLLDPPVVGLRLRFAPRFAGLPLVDAPSWVTVEWLPGLEPSVHYYRRVFARLEEFPGFRMPVLDARKVLEAASALPAQVLPPASRRVWDMSLGYRVDESGLVLPAWVVHLADGSRLVWDGFAAGPLPRFWGRRDAPAEER